MRKPRKAVLLLSCLLLFGGPLVAQDLDEYKSALEALEALEDVEIPDDPENVLAWVVAPRSMEKGDSGSVTITIENARSDRAFQLRFIDISDEFLRGIKILSVDPKPRHQDHSFGTLTLEYPIDIAPNGTHRFEIKFRAKKKGIFVGDIDIYEGEQFLTRAVQSRVH